jgi:sugar phosphate isomerase/epimerase
MNARNDRQLGADDLVLDHLTLDWQHPLRDRVASAASAGCAGIGLLVNEYVRLCDGGFDIEELADLLDEFDVALVDLEVVRVWPASERAVATRARAERAAWQLADRFGCRCLQVVGPTRGDDLASTAARFGELCDSAADHGLLVALEGLPFTDVAGEADAMRIIDAADRPNGGLCVDVWHHRRGPMASRTPLHRIPVERIFNVQLNDGPMVADDEDYVVDCLRNRVPPGNGDMDVVGFMSTLLARGVSVPWSIEVCSASGWAQPSTGWVEACATGVRTALAQARARAGT